MSLDELLSKMYDYLLNYTTEDALDMLLSINGDNVETYKDALYYLTGYRDFDQIDERFYE